MEQSANKERQIVQWKVNTVSWRVEEFLETHPEYKKPDNDSGFVIWPAIFTIADQLGLDENIMHTLFDEKPECKITDLVFVLYLIRLYGRQVLEEFFNYKDTIKLGEVHGFIKGHEGLLQSIDVSSEKSDIEEHAETNSVSTSKTDSLHQKTEELTHEDLKKCVKNFIQLMQQQETTKKEFTTVIDRLLAEKEKQQEQTALKQVGGENSGPVKNTDAEVASLWKRFIKSEKENAVLKTQLEAERREAILKHEAAMEMKCVEMEHLKKQMDIYISSLEELRKENEELHQENADLKLKTQSIRYEQIQSRLGILRNQKKRKSMNASPMDERQEFVMKILSDSAYPVFLKEFIVEAYQNGMDLKRMQTFDNPKLEKSNFEMMKAIISIN